MRSETVGGWSFLFEWHFWSILDRDVKGEDEDDGFIPKWNQSVLGGDRDIERAATLDFIAAQIENRMNRVSHAATVAEN